MKSIKDFVYYFRSCPLCSSWITLDVDSPVPTSLEIKDDRLIFTKYRFDGRDNSTYEILFSDNSVIGDDPFVLDDFVSMIKRLYYDEYKESFKIEARCYGCNRFRYWSTPITYNAKKKKIRGIGIGGEKFRIIEKDINYTISNNPHLKETSVFVFQENAQSNKIKIPYISFKKIDFKNINKMLEKIKKLLLLA